MDDRAAPNRTGSGLLRSTGEPCDLTLSAGAQLPGHVWALELGRDPVGTTVNHTT